MPEQVRDPKTRFSDRVDDYIKYRPRYGSEVVEALERACGLAPSHVIADIGCGTGFSAEPFLEDGNRVVGVEPNREMREAGAHYLAKYPKFEMRDGTAERTGLPDAERRFRSGRAGVSLVQPGTGTRRIRTSSAPRGLVRFDLA